MGLGTEPGTGRAVLMMRSITSAAESSGCAARTRATAPATSGVAPLVPSHCTYPPPGLAPTSCSLGADTPIVIPCDEASKLALPARLTPATVSTPGIVAGAPTSFVPLPRLPAAATRTTSCAKAYWNASSQLGGQSRVLRVRDMLITDAPLSTDQRTAWAICSS